MSDFDTAARLSIAFRGQRCFAVVHSAIGVSFEFGDKRLRKRPIQNPVASEVERLYDGSHSLFVLERWWTAKDGREQESPEDVVGLVGASIVECTFIAPNFDLCVTFDDGTRLRVDTLIDSAETTYSLGVERTQYEFLPAGVIVESTRAS